MDYKKKYREAQKWIESIYTELSHEHQMEAEAFFPELKESEDEKMMHQLHSWMKEFGGAEEYTEKVYTWLKSLLEKQGKKETLCDKCRKEHPSHSCQDITALGRCALEKQDEQKKSYDVCDSSMMDNKKSPYGEKRDFGYFEEKPTDKVEPKFKNGQWIVWQNKCYKVNYNGCGYELIDQNGLSTSLEYGTVDKNAHLWDITKDAKAGDVLADVYGNIGIYKKHDDFDWTSYCSLGNNGGFQPFEIEHENERTYPATKEQRDLLFQKMYEAGYEWDAEKKELKKISQIMVSAEAKEALYDKPVWSEEDETGWTNTMIMIKEVASNHYTKDSIKLVIDWLKSLKERYTWKPSDEQMIALSEASGIVGMLTPRGMHLQSLYNDLKKLTE